MYARGSSTTQCLKVIDGLLLAAAPALRGLQLT
jgi:hypothetical protein